MAIYGPPVPDTLGMGHQEQIPLYGPPMSDTSHISHQRCHVTAPLQHNSKLFELDPIQNTYEALGGATERRGAFGPRTAARDAKRCIRAVRATKIERTRTEDMRSLARAANQRGEGARLVGGQAPWSQFLLVVTIPGRSDQTVPAQ
jgi:hypothetical protein